MPLFATQQTPQRKLGYGPALAARDKPGVFMGATREATCACRETGAAEPAWEVWKTATWFVLTRVHAHLVLAHPHKFLLEIADEYYISTLLRTLDRANETTCDWAGPTYTNWTDPTDPDMEGASHPRTFHALDSSLLDRMRRSSSFRDVSCDWRAAVDTAAMQFSSLREWAVEAWPPDYLPMPETCPLIARKFAADATESVIASLWPRAAEANTCALLPPHEDFCRPMLSLLGERSQGRRAMRRK